MAKINIITAFYNTDLELFKESLRSVPISNDVKQIIINDGSTNISKDELADFVYKNTYNQNYYLLHLDKNSGPGAARNQGFKHLDDNCKYICFLDSDDRLRKDSIEQRAFALDILAKVGKNIVAVYGNKDTLDIRDGGCAFTYENTPEFDRNLLMQQCYIPSNSIMFRRDIFNTYIGKMNENVRLCEDWLLWRQLSLLGNILKIDINTYIQVIHGTNLSCQQGILYNHMRDMLETQSELETWYEDLKSKWTSKNAT